MRSVRELAAATGYTPSCGEFVPHKSHNGFATENPVPWCKGLTAEGKPAWPVPAKNDAPVQMFLPRRTLDYLKEVWESGDDDRLEGVAVRILRDLFDGQDGHLYRIDAALAVHAAHGATPDSTLRARLQQLLEQHAGTA